MESVYDIVAQWNISSCDQVKIKDNVWKIFTDEGNYALKRSTLSEKKLSFIAEGQQALTRYGFWGFSHPLYCKEKPYYEKENAFYTLYEWVEGEKCDFDNLEHLGAAAESLAAFHLYSRSVDLRQKYKKKMLYFNWNMKIKERIHDLEVFREKAAKGERRFFEKMYLGFCPLFLQKAAESQRLLLTSSYPKIAKEEMTVGAFIHYDVAARNFVIQKDRAYLIDFDYCCLDLTLVDLMRLIKRSLKYGENAAAKLDVIISSYTAVKPVSYEEWQVLYALLIFPQKYWRLGERYYSGGNDWSEETFAKKMRNTVEESEKESLWLPMFKDRVGLI